jgi:glycine dehydrogenase subunit 2
MLVPDAAHGTNPATAKMCGFNVVKLPSNDQGLVDVEALKAAVSERTAGLMLTNPNTLGLFEKDIEEIAKIVHGAGGLLYYDGANLNANLGKIRPGDSGFDVVHMNLHKTFSTPHGGGGPGSGAVGCCPRLESFLPTPIIVKEGDKYVLDNNRPDSIGKVHGYFGNFGVCLKAYTYIMALGAEGLRESSEHAVLASNYLMHFLKDLKGFELPFAEGVPRKHEFVLSAEPMKKEIGISAGDVSKKLLDFGVHAPTNYFPLVVQEALMIEPTESFSKEVLDYYIAAFKEISASAYSNPELIKQAPNNVAVTRLDEAKASRPTDLALTWRMHLKREAEKKGT